MIHWASQRGWRPPSQGMPAKRIAIVQSSYIPWKGYFDLIRSVDEFILLDDVQFTKRDWRSRNRIKTQHGPAWLTVPVRTKGRYLQLIQDTVVSEPDWGPQHWAAIRAAYARAPFFRQYAGCFESLYQAGGPEERLSAINHRFTNAICHLLGITTPITWSTDYGSADGRNERLIELCRRASATRYLSGPSAAQYIDRQLFADAGIAVEFADYDGYPEYPQIHPPFEHFVSILDLLFCTGPDALSYMKRL
jgi:hypothetical protein